ncbi:hypothetical protein C8Q78DRAFT_486545 [Trametes maxima]|nr:hypothetical protein C8Q78DRAFT_486545 [Trametes maxima]
MRDVSLPAWTVLSREPSSGSVPPSEDELLSRASQDMVDEIDSTPPAQPSPTQSKRPGPRLGESRLARRTGAPGSSGGSSQTASAGPSKPPPLSFPARRPLPSSDEEEVPRPKKKKKLIINPERSGMATAGTRVSLFGRLPIDSASPFGTRNAPNLPNTTQDARRNRRVTIDGALPGGSGAQSGSQADGGKRSAGVGLTSSPRIPLPRKASALGSILSQTPLQRARARQKSANNPSGRDVPTQASSGSSAADPTQSRPQYAPAPPPHEVIEILDSDDDPPPTQPPKAPERPPRPAVPPPRARPDLPRTHRSKHPPEPVPKYKEDDNGVIILDSDDEETTTTVTEPPHQDRDSVPAPLPSRPVSQTSAPSVPSSGDSDSPPSHIAASSGGPSPPEPALTPTEPPALAPDTEDVTMADEESPDVNMDEGSPRDEESPVLHGLNLKDMTEPPNPEPSPSSEQTSILDNKGVSSPQLDVIPVGTVGAELQASVEELAHVPSPMGEGTEKLLRKRKQIFPRDPPV